jgi:hypothetical protein
VLLGSFRKQSDARVGILATYGESYRVMVLLVYPSSSVENAGKLTNRKSKNPDMHE